MNPFFSIIVVCLNAGEELKKTVDSVLGQSFADYEILIKDGGSKDGSLEALPEHEKITVHVKDDQSIYDAMNQATEYVRGRFVMFLNCGDYFYDSHVLEQVYGQIMKSEKSSRAAQEGDTGAIYYGNIYERKTGQVVNSNPDLNAFGCYRNVPCHQCCFYPASLIVPSSLQKMGRERTFVTDYRVRADYEHFLWCFFSQKVCPQYMPVTVCSYAGGGFSETEENRKRSEKEHKEITRCYMSTGMRFRYRMMLLLSLAPLRTRMARSKYFSGIYQRLKRFLYRG